MVYGILMLIILTFSFFSCLDGGWAYLVGESKSTTEFVFNIRVEAIC